VRSVISAIEKNGKGKCEPRFERVHEEALGSEREEHVVDVGNDQHLRLLESRLWDQGVS
jgi:hypothetical protein